MSRYEREDYEDLDEYEDEELEDEEVGEDEYEYEEEQEEPRQPTQQELEYLELRKQLKDSIRKQMKKENGSSLGHSQERRKKLPFDNYGSFFGPSQPVIAPRVIQESISFLENERLTAKVPKPSHNNKTSAPSSSNGGSKNQVHVSHPKVVNEVKSKVQKVKAARDYSFLMSDDVELPAPRKDPPRNVSARPSSSDARSAHGPPKNKQLSSINGRNVANGSRPSIQNGGRPVQNGSRQVSNGSRQEPSGSRQVSNGSRQEPSGSRQVANGRQEHSGSRQIPNGREVKKNVQSAGHLHPRADPGKLSSASKPVSRTVDPRKQLANSNGSGPGRPLASKPLSSGTMQKKAPLSGARSAMQSVSKSSSTKLQSSGSKQPLVSKQSPALKQQLDQRKGYQDPRQGKIFSKQPVPSSRPQISKPSGNIPSRTPLQKDRLKKRPRRPYSDDEDDYGGGSGVSSIIQKMMGYNPNKYRDRDLDDSDMEAGFDDILREERRSAKIAKMEDEEELRKIEEEERRERMRKKQKLGR